MPLGVNTCNVYVCFEGATHKNVRKQFYIQTGIITTISNIILLSLSLSIYYRKKKGVVYIHSYI